MQKNKEEQTKKELQKKEQQKKEPRKVTVEEAIQLSMRQFARAIEYLKDK